MHHFGMRNPRLALAVAGATTLGLCVLGMAVAAAGLLMGVPALEVWGGWLTIPWTIVTGGAVGLLVLSGAAIVLGWPVMALWRRVRPEPPRRSRYFSR